MHKKTSAAIVKRASVCKSKRPALIALVFSGLLSCSSSDGDGVIDSPAIDVGDRPGVLVSQLSEGAFKTKLAQCDLRGIEPTDLSISHRGAPYQFPEHTREGYLAAAQQGAGAIECDVTFTKDRELVCRHSQCDLHSTTNILATGLADRCRVPPDISSATPYANVECCTSDITLSEFRTLKGKRDGGNKLAATLDAYFAATPGWVSAAPENFGELLTHSESIDLFQSLGVAMVPELKAPQVAMPYEGDYSQSMYATQLLDEYTNAGVEAGRVFPQSFSLNDIRHWVQTAPDYARQSIYLDGRYRENTFDINDANSWLPTMDELAADGVQYLASPLWMLLTTDSQQQLTESTYARIAKAAGLKLVAWTVERGGPISTGNNWYYQTIKSATSNEGDVLKVIDTLINEVGVTSIFSDWPATTSFVAHCTK